MNFKARETANKIIDDIKKYYKENNAKGAIIGISGGKDSAVVASLLTKALGKENVIGFWLPCHSNELDRIDAYKVAKCLGIKMITHDLTKTYDEIINDVKNNQEITTDELLINANINIKPRLRINILYYYAAYYTALKQELYLVAGT